MKKADLNGVRPAITNRPFLGRFIALGCLLIMIPLLIPLSFWHGLKEVLPDFIGEATQALGVIFLPWEDRGDNL